MNIMNCKDIKADHLTVLIYGTPGMGKTTLLGRLPGKTLIIDVDKGTSVLAGNENVDVLRLSENISEMQLVIKELRSKCDYGNVCIDSLSELERSMLAYRGRIGNNNGVPSQGDYLRVDYFLIDWCRQLRSLPCNVIFTAWEKYTDLTTASGDKVTAIRPMLRDKNVENLCGLCDIVGRIYVDAEKKERLVKLEGSPTLIAKDRIYQRKYCHFEDILAGTAEKGANK